MPRTPVKTVGIVLLAALVAASLWLVLKPGGAPAYRNVVLVTIDTLRADHLSSYGYPHPTSPFIDSLAQRGVLFENALAATSHTAPSHATMFTSLNPESHGVHVNGTRMPEGMDTLASALGRHGYETAAFTGIRFLELVADGFDHFGIGNRQASRVVDRAIAWLDKQHSGAPVFLWVHLYDVHQHQVTKGPHQEFSAQVRAGDVNGEEASGRRVSRRLRKRLLTYDARIAYVDDQVERLFDAVESGGLEGDTLWVITSDHGEGLGDHGYMGHGKYLYSEQLHVPLILFPAPGATAGARIEGLSRLLDLRPTVFDLLKLEDPRASQHEGVSLAPYVLRPGASVDINFSYSQRRPAEGRKGWVPGLVIAAQTPEWKYIYNETREDEVYDLRSDPQEKTNLAGQELREAEQLRRWLLTQYRDMHENRPADAGEIEPEFLEELKALGYVD